MALDKLSLVNQLAALTGDLQPSPGTSETKLEEAVALVAQAIAAGQTDSAIRVSGGRAIPTMHPLTDEQKAKLESVVDVILSHPPPAAQFLVARREVPLAGANLADLSPEWANGRAVDRTLGPFVDAVGRPVWIDLFYIVRQFHLVRSPGAAPFLSVPLEGLHITGSGFTLPAGSIWIACRELAPASPTGSYTGLRIRGGVLAFSQNLTGSGNEIVVPLAVTCALSLDLDPGTAPSGPGAGEDARLATADVPRKVTFVFSSAGGKIQSVGKAKVSVYGSSANVDPTTNPPTYVASVARIFVPAQTVVNSFSVTDVRSDEFQPSGTAPLDAAAWALPVAVVSPDSLGNAAGAGGLALVLKAGLTLTWKSQSTPVPAGPVMLIVDAGVISVVALTAQGLGTSEIIPLWSAKPGAPASSQIELSWPSQFALRFFASSAGAELLLFIGSLSGNFDRPITVAGNRVFVQSHLALIIFVESAVFTGIIVEAALDQPPTPVSNLAFAIANAVFRTTPARTLLLAATWDGTRSAQGGLAIGFDLEYLLPILPDPYAANISLPEGRLVLDTGAIGPLFAIVVWSSANAPVLGYVLPPNATALGGVMSTPAATARTQTAATGPFATTIGSGALILLDLSTNVDQFGVAWRSAGRDTTVSQRLAVDSMYLESLSSSVYVLTLPAVQWEPVFTESPPAFPSPLTFADSGGPTAIAVQSVQLVRISPAPALDNLVLNFGTSPSPQPALARLTLPFGIQAFSTWNKPGVAGPSGATVEYNRPNFPTESLVGGYQISVRAVDPAAPDSPSLQGYTVQLRNGLFSGVPANKSVLDDQVDTIFNGYLSSTGLRPQVPVTRLDLSGYGESLFSDWLNQTDDPVAVSQARFDVLIGRTAYEVIQVRSVLYPYGVRVVRTITIDRKNSGSVVRKDSGWQAVSDGEYLFPGVGLTTHPGVVQRISNVTNIRDTGQMIDVVGAQVAGVLFDGDLAIEGVVKGASPSGVPARDQIGYVQLTPASSGSLLPSQYQNLINSAGPLGGTIDCVINIGGSGQLMKLGRVGVGITQGLGGPEFVMTAWGSPQFPLGGQWSFLRQTGVGTAPEVVEQDLGIPLIRAGAAPSPPPITSPYRFADPVDLATPDTPASDYGIVHATGTQRVFFPRPKIEATAPNRITSTRTPVLADPYSLATAVGYFPRTDSAIPFPSSNYAIVIAGGNYQLQMPSPNFPVTVGQRTIAEAGGVRGYADYAGATATLVIDTSAAVPWSFQLKDVNIATSSGLLGEVLRVTATVDAAANIVTTFKNSKVTFGGALGVIQDVLAFLQTLGFPSPLGVAMTNKIKLKAGLRIPMDEELNTLMPPGGPQFDDTDVVVSVVIASPVTEVDFEMGATLLIPTPFDPLKAVGMFKLEIDLSTTTGTTLILTAGAGVGVGFSIGPFDCKAYFLLTLDVVIGTSVLGLAVGVLIKGTVDLEIVEVHVSVEAKMAVLKVTCPATTIYGAAQLTFAIEVHICFIIDIDFEIQAELDKNLNGGPCALPDVL
jgi:hypothetical protein